MAIGFLHGQKWIPPSLNADDASVPIQKKPHDKHSERTYAPAAYSHSIIILNNMSSASRSDTTLDAARDDNEKDDVDDNALVLTCDQLHQVNDFRELLNRTDDTDRLQLCAEKCSELLRHDTGLQMLIAAYDDVMSAVCRRFENKRRRRLGRRYRPAATRSPRVRPSVTNGSATSASPPAQPRSNPTVSSPSRPWHFAGVEQSSSTTSGRPGGENFCNLLRARAVEISEWRNFALALTFVMLRRHGKVRRHGIAYSRDPITSSDLMELKGFPLSEIQDSTLPAGFGLDEFGIMVHEQFAVRPPPAPAVPNRLHPTYQPSPPTAPAIRNYQICPETDTEPSEPPSRSQHRSRTFVFSMPVTRQFRVEFIRPPYAGMSLRQRTPALPTKKPRAAAPGLLDLPSSRPLPPPKLRHSHTVLYHQLS